ENIQAASDEVTTTQESLAQTQKDLSAMSYLQFIPVAGWYYGDASHLLQAGVYGLNATQILIEAIKPYADVLGLKGTGTFTGGTAQQRIQTAVTTMSKITPKIDEIAAQAKLAQAEIDKVDPWHYPAIFGGKPINDLLTKVKTYADEGVTFVDQAKPLIKVLPEMLGEPNAKKYLVLFQNDKELRPTGGFLTAYAIFQVEHGVIKVDKSEDIYTLDATIPNKPSAPRPILQYLPKVPLWNIRDTNISPDFKTSMDEFNKMYQTSSEYEKVDGIIAIDTHVLVTAMTVLGDISVDGQTFSTKEDPTCHCAQVIHALEISADQPTETVRTNRKGIIGDLMYAIMQKAFSSSPKLYWGQLFQAMISDISEKHMLFDLYNSDAQSGLDALNATGQIKAFDGDYLHINDTNFGGAKSNLYVTEAVIDDYHIASDGTVTKTITINYKNPYPPSDCNLEHGNLCLNAVFRDWLRLYVPQGSKLVSSKGSQVDMKNYDELGKTVFEGFLTVAPLGSTTFTISYTLPFKLASGSPLPVLIQKQPGTDANSYVISRDGGTLQSFTLTTDKQTILHLR
ncbi:MAG TPA: DUF4012 domain-containing protein, partial [Patescibacteria group bacterium]|nr:DUF4012 domain-containing protein [Patescibacteria group bacterium]